MKIISEYGGEADIYAVDAELFFKKDKNTHVYHGQISEYHPGRPCYQIVGKVCDSSLSVIIRVYEMNNGTNWTEFDVFQEVLRLRKLCMEDGRYRQKRKEVCKQLSSSLDGVEKRVLKSREQYLQKQIRAIEKQAGELPKDRRRK